MCISLTVFLSVVALETAATSPLQVMPYSKGHKQKTEIFVCLLAFWVAPFIKRDIGSHNIAVFFSIPKTIIDCDHFLLAANPLF
jgi:hypothetical protein